MPVTAQTDRHPQRRRSMDGARAPERYDTLIIGGGQTGLSTGYHLRRRGVPFVILEASDRIGDVWRNRWDSLRLFTPARYDGLPGMPYPARPHYFPTKDEMGDYLEAYAERFDLPVRTGTRVDRVTRHERGDFLVTAGEQHFRADNVVVAMANYQEPHVPDFASELDPDIVQLHSRDYRNPSQLEEGPVLIVGAGNSGSEIAMELASSHSIWMSGRDTGHLPFRIAGTPARYLWIPLILRVLFHRILNVNTPIGRKLRHRFIGHGGPLIRVMPRDLKAAGVERVPRTAGVERGLPVLEDGRVLDARNVIWCTGFDPGFESWIDLPIGDGHEPDHDQGVVPGQPGLFFVGLHFLRSLSSAMIHAADRDGELVARAVEARRTAAARTPTPRSTPTSPRPELADAVRAAQ